jgi:ectoine hydroxylase-related dioxygenase (phytanoyl-CoA dioxygenase family)
MSSEFRVQGSESRSFSRFAEEGFQIVRSVVTDNECDLLAAELAPLFEAQQKAAGSKIGGVRNLLGTSRRVAQLAGSEKIISVLKEAVGRRPFPVRAIFFDKNPEANWLVPWHQDLAVAVTERVEAAGFTGWSIKDGVSHVHPPQDVLEGMITLRLHLDDCGVENGALKVIAGSHRLGKLGAAEISDCTKSNQPVICEILKGGVLLMRPLLLHASLPAKKPSHRRVLHIEYATGNLPGGLEWFKN